MEVKVGTKFYNSAQHKRGKIYDEVLKIEGERCTIIYYTAIRSRRIGDNPSDEYAYEKIDQSVETMTISKQTVLNKMELFGTVSNWIVRKK